MALTIGSQLGSHEITALLGKGGMGEVYRARDLKLKREVAIKVLPDEFSRDVDRLGRFQREAEVLAALNHPNIANIYDLEEHYGSRYLVLELVEGETLADRVANGPIPVEEALAIARQIAEGLEAAHEKGIIHRDLKPANVKITPDGKVKVLDFGLARALETTPVDSSLSNSPTLSLAATQAGIILGTAAYMPPEQAKGRTADRRADIWAFGVVLYEMLTGRMMFSGETVSETMAQVLLKEPDWNTLPANTPLGLRDLLSRCLVKDPRNRMRDIGDARIAIEEIKARPEQGKQRSVAQRGLGWLAGVAMLGLLLGAAIVLWIRPPSHVGSPDPPLRLNADLGADVSLAVNSGAALALSPDGQLLAFIGSKLGKTQLYVRRLSQLQATSLAGTDGAADPFFDPEGQWIGFFANGKLKKISVNGGGAITLCDAPAGRGGTWGEDGNIIFTPNSTANINLMRVSSAGGKVEPQTTFTQGEIRHRWPDLLPGNKAVLYTSATSGSSFFDSNVVVQPLPGGAPKVLVRGGYYGRYVSSGHLVYIHDGTLFAAPFDLNRLELTGPAVPAVEGVNNASGGGSAGRAEFAVSSKGTLVYLPGQTGGALPPISWLDHTGKITALRPAGSNWSNPHFSPDGRTLALDINDGKNTDVFTYEWERNTLTRFTFDPAEDRKPVYNPDGRRIAFGSIRGGTINLYWQRSDLGGEIQRLTESKNPQQPSSFHPNGKYLAFYEQNQQTGWDLMILPIDGDEAAGWKPGKPYVFLGTPANEQEPMFSPDGRWIAYQSDESGNRNEIFVRPFPGPGGQRQISDAGGQWPTWSRSRHEMFYKSPDGHIMVVPYTTDKDTFKPDKPRVWSERTTGSTPRQRTLDLHPDGERFAVWASAESETEAPQDKVVFIFNFADELRRLAPPSKK